MEQDITATPFGTAASLLAREQGRSIEHVIHTAWQPDRPPSVAAMRKAISGDRTASIAVMEAVARSLGVPAQLFADYRLAKAREALDPKSVGLEQALAALKRIEGALVAAPARGRAKQGQPRAGSGPQLREAGRAPSRRKANGPSGSR